LAQWHNGSEDTAGGTAEGATRRQTNHTMAGSFISSQTRISVFCTYLAPLMPVSLLKYLSVGQPPAPAWRQDGRNKFHRYTQDRARAHTHTQRTRGHTHGKHTAHITHKETDRQTYRQTDRQTDTHIGGFTVRTWCFCMSSLDSLQFTSAKATLSLGGKLSYTAFQPGCCFIHQPHLRQRARPTRGTSATPRLRLGKRAVDGGRLPRKEEPHEDGLACVDFALCFDTPCECLNVRLSISTPWQRSCMQRQQAARGAPEHTNRSRPRLRASCTRSRHGALRWRAPGGPAAGWARSSGDEFVCKGPAGATGRARLAEQKRGQAGRHGFRGGGAYPQYA
jgi:hypothetical protein